MALDTTRLSTKVKLWLRGDRLIKCNGTCNQEYWIHKRWHENFKCNPCSDNSSM